MCIIYILVRSKQAYMYMYMYILAEAVLPALLMYFGFKIMDYVHALYYHKYRMNILISSNNSVGIVYKLCIFDFTVLSKQNK